MKKDNIVIIIIVSVILSLICGIIGGLALSNNTNFGKGVNKIIRTITEKEEVNDSISYSVDNIYDAVVVIEEYNNGKLTSTGTGFVYKQNDSIAYIMTNNHVISSGGDIKVIFSDKSAVSAKLLGGETYSDIAVLAVDSKKILGIASLGKTSNLRVGDTVFSVGSPEGVDFAGSVTKGILSGKDRMVSVSVTGSEQSDYYMKTLQTDTAINPGNSGGPLCNINGEVIGITNMKLVDSKVEGIGFAIPIEDALFYAATLETGKTITRPYLGLSVLDITDSFYLWQNKITIPDNIKEGTVVIDVDKNSPAKKLKKGDIITKIDDNKISSSAELRYYLYKYNVGDTIKITYIRDKSEKEIKIKLNRKK